MTNPISIIPLRPFPGSSHPAITLSVGIQQLSYNKIKFEYFWKGCLDLISIPKLNSHSERKDLLWEHTCMEAFLSWGTNPAYWELNVSPSGDWNVYLFDHYRSTQKTELKIFSIECRVLEHTADSYQFLILLDLSAISPPDSFLSELHVGLTAVMEESAGGLSYWAAKHSGTKPDFHLRDSFSTTLGPNNAEPTRT